MKREQKEIQKIYAQRIGGEDAKKAEENRRMEE